MKTRQKHSWQYFKEWKRGKSTVGNILKNENAAKSTVGNILKNENAAKTQLAIFKKMKTQHKGKCS